MICSHFTILHLPGVCMWSNPCQIQMKEGGHFRWSAQLLSPDSKVKICRFKTENDLSPKSRLLGTSQRVTFCLRKHFFRWHNESLPKPLLKHPQSAPWKLPSWEKLFPQLGKYFFPVRRKKMPNWAMSLRYLLNVSRRAERVTKCKLSLKTILIDITTSLL